MQSRTLDKPEYKVFIVVLLAISLVIVVLQHASASQAAEQQQDPPMVVTLENGYEISFMGVDYDEVEDASTWTYHVEELDYAQDLSFWVLELPFCIEVLDASAEPWETVHPDPNAQLTGIKWETGDGFESGDFWVKAAGQWNVGETEVAAKGPDLAYGIIAGPSCEQNQAPVVADDEVATYVNWDIAIPVLNNDYDPDGDVLYLTDFMTATLEGGTVARVENGTPGDTSDDHLVYTPTLDFEGLDSFGYTAGDGILTGTATVSATVLALPDPPIPPIANPDTFIVGVSPFEVPSPGLLLNDQLLDYTDVQVLPGDGPVSGTLTLGPDGSFSYTPDTDFFGEDSFTYAVQATGTTTTVTSTFATVTLQVLDIENPTVEWVSPVPEDEVQVIGQEDIVELAVLARDNHSIDRVEFFRWNPVAEEYLAIAEVKSAPYSVEVQASDLNMGYNQVYAAVYDGADNRSDVEHIWLYKEASFSIYLPMTIR